MLFDPSKPFNSMPLLPPEFELETKVILKQLAVAHRYLAELKGIAQTIPDRSILISTLALQEAKDSSAIENIITTHDELYKSDLFADQFDSPAAKEVHRYAKALVQGFNLIKDDKLLTVNRIIEIQKVLEDNDAGVRRIPGTVLKNTKTGETIYTPPDDPRVIIEALSNLEKYINDDEFHKVDPLIKMAVIHYQFETIHPFFDGNGRTGRIINVLYLVLNNLLEMPVLYLSRYIIENKSEYYRLLNKVCSENAYSVDGAWIVTGSGAGPARIWDAATGHRVLTLGGQEPGVTSVACSADGARIVTGSWGRTARVWDAATDRPVLTLGGREGGVASVACSADGARIVTGGWVGTASVWDAATGQLVLTLGGREGGVTSVAFSADGARIVTGSWIGTARVWDAATGHLVLSLGGHGRGVWSVAYSAVGGRIVTASRDKSARVWDAATGQLVLTLGGEEDRVTSVACSADGARIFTGSWDGTARVWDAATGELIRTLGGHEGGISSAAYSADGARIVTGGWDGTARVWDAATGHLVQTLDGHEGGVSSAVFSAYGARVVTGGWDGAARVWDSKSGRLLSAMSGLFDGWFSLDYRADPRGLWRGEGRALDDLVYRDTSEEPGPAPWVPRYWHAVDLPELKAPD